jgi:hypothetical protein
MKLNLRGLIAALFAVSAAGLLHCGSSSNLGTPQTGDGGIQPGETPLEHFPAGFSCRATRPAGINTDSGSCDADAGANCTCNADSECRDGKNGRCVVVGNGRPICDYDECFAASDCASGSSCACGDIYAISNNVCVPSNCRVDTDCGANGFCSPSYGSCGKFGGEYEGIYCHTAKDTCVNDSDCTGGANGNGPGFCAFATESNAWECSYTFCAG